MATHRPEDGFVRMAEQPETTEKSCDIQRRMLEAAARRPRSRADLAERLRDGKF